jgi:hypothetical protein
MGDFTRSYQWMERFVCAFETHWDRLIQWYDTDSNEAKSLEWRCFAAAHGDRTQAMAAARYTLLLFVQVFGE